MILFFLWGEVKWWLFLFRKFLPPPPEAGEDHPRATSFRQALLMGGESLLCLPLYREPTHYPHLTNHAAAIKCIATQSNKMCIVNISWYLSALHLWVWVWKKYCCRKSLAINKTFLRESLRRAQIAWAERVCSFCKREESPSYCWTRWRQKGHDSK